MRVSATGGSRPAWRKDGRELYFISRSGQLMAVSIDASGERVRPGDPRALFDAPLVGVQINRTQYVATPDGERFLFNARVDDAGRQGIAIGDGVLPPLSR